MYNDNDAKRWTNLDTALPDNTELFVGITLVKRNGEFVVKSQFCKVQGSYESKKEGTKKDKTIKKEQGLKSLRDLEITEGEF